MLMASQLLSPCITVLLEGLQGESQDEVGEAYACHPIAEAYRVASVVVETLPWLSGYVRNIHGPLVLTIGYVLSR